jgi:hypothetical protein
MPVPELELEYHCELEDKRGSEHTCRDRTFSAIDVEMLPTMPVTVSPNDTG